MGILRSVFVLLLFQYAGTLLHAFLHLPLPGPVVGMVLLAIWLLTRRPAARIALETTADGLLAWLGLLFVPAGVGVVANLALLRAAWLPTTVALVGSTLLTLAVTAGTMSVLQRKVRA